MAKMAKKEVWIIMGSDSDSSIMRSAYDTLKEFGVPVQMMVSSAHRSPKRTSTIAKSAEKKGVGCFIVGAGAAAHLAGVIAAETPLPVIGVPINATALDGMDALLATVQMPGGVPVACMAIGKAGAKNAALFAVQMLSLSDNNLKEKYAKYKADQAKGVVAKNTKLQKTLKA